ncbi:MAG: S41 family peptidase [Chlamydiales bacterium]|nr:S41 family peptidase [Chlamydiales bacterium]
MYFRRVTTILATVLIIMIPAEGQAESHSLKTNEIKGIMAEMLGQHIDRPSVTPQTYSDAVRHYIEQGDYYHLYLLESEARPWLRMDMAAAAEGVNSYQNGDYTVFSKVNQLLENGIYRSRQLRKFDPQVTAGLFKEAAKRMKENSSWVADTNGFASNEAALEQRLKDNFVEYVISQMSSFGIDKVLANQDIIASKYEHSMRHFEREYLFGGNDPTPPVDQENFFATHVLKALAKSLDAHSSFFDDTEAEDMKMRLEKGFMGTGVVISEVIDGFVISDMLTDSPAMRGGQIKINDRLEKVNGRVILGMSLDEVGQLLRSVKDGNSMVISISRMVDGQTQSSDVTLVPEMLVVDKGRVDSSFEKYGDGIIGRITLYSFYEGPKGISSASDIANAIENLKKQGNLKGLILDLRGNSGGYLTQAVKVAGLFISNGVVVMSKYNNGEEHYYRDVDGTKAYDGPLVILTSKLTASAAEIVAQTLQDYGVAVVVGDEHTYGKGTIQAQTVTEGNTNTYFKVTVGKYYTVSGNTTQIRGVRADVLLPGEYSEMQIGESYLETSIGNDVIQAAYTDSLQDVEPRARMWYTEHYLPTLQIKQTRWQSLLPEIKLRSAKRVQSEQQYQQFLKALTNTNEAIPDIGSFDIAGYQLQEATRIVGDMIEISSQMAGGRVDSTKVQIGVKENER